MAPDLRSVQELLYRLIVAPEGVAEGLRAESDLPSGGLETIVRGDERLSAIERLDIYADMYFYRLLDCMKEDYPATLAVVGADNFHNLITGYLPTHPPSHPSLLYAGRHLADYMNTHPLREEWPFIADLTRLERALIEVFHGPEASALEPNDLRMVAATVWPTLELRTHPALQVLTLEWNVAEVLRAVEEKNDWDARPREAAGILVWRKNNRCYYRDVDAAELAGIRALANGASLAALCECVAAVAAVADPSALIFELLGRWLDDGILVRANR